MKNMKSKLLASVAMLLVSAIMLTSASFAWFTISTAPEISNIQTSVTANGNLEIALDAGSAAEPDDSDVGDSGKNETWGNLVDLNEYFSEAEEIVLKPVDVNEANGEVKVPLWGLDGRVSELKAMDATSVTTANAYDDLSGLYVYADENDDIYALRVDFWLRSNVGGNVVLSAAADRGAGEEGLGSYLEGEMAEKIKVAFQIPTEGNTPDPLIVATAEADESIENRFNLVIKEENEEAELCTLTKNEAKMVSMYVYMDGADLKNEDFLNEATDLALNVQFALDGEELEAMEVTASENGRASAAKDEEKPVG